METNVQIGLVMAAALSLLSIGLILTGAVLATARRAFFLAMGLVLLALIRTGHLLTWEVPLAISGHPADFMLEGGLSQVLNWGLRGIGILGWILVALGAAFLPRASAARN
jgi:hypothetical protein